MAFNPIQAIAGGIGSGFLGYDDPSGSAQQYLSQIPGQLQKYFEPYINRGNQAGDALQGQYGNLLNDPGGMLNKIGGGYQQSPGFKFALQQAMQGAGHAAAAGGMAGSPQHEQQNMGLATNLANQDYNSWIQNALGLYGRGLSGQEGMYGIGAKAGMGLGENLAHVLALQGQYGYAGKAGQNTYNSELLKNIFGLFGAANTGGGASSIGSFLR